MRSHFNGRNNWSIQNRSNKTAVTLMTNVVRLNVPTTKLSTVIDVVGKNEASMHYFWFLQQTWKPQTVHVLCRICEKWSYPRQPFWTEHFSSCPAQENLKRIFSILAIKKTETSHLGTTHKASFVNAIYFCYNVTNSDSIKKLLVNI